MKVRNIVVAFALCLAAAASMASNVQVRFFVNQTMDGNWQNFTTSLSNHGSLKDGYFDTKVLAGLVYQRAKNEGILPKGLEEESAFIAAFLAHNGLAERVEANEFRRLAQSDRGFTLPPAVEATAVAVAASAALTPEQEAARRRDDAIAAHNAALAKVNSEVKNLKDQRVKDAEALAKREKELRGEATAKAANAAKAAVEPVAKDARDAKQLASDADGKANALNDRLAAVENNPVLKWGAVAIGLLFLLTFGAYAFNWLTHRKAGEAKKAAEECGGVKTIALEAKSAAGTANANADAAGATALRAERKANEAMRLVKENVPVLPADFDDQIVALAQEGDEYKCMVMFGEDRGIVTVKKAADGKFILTNVRDQNNAVAQKNLKRVIRGAAYDGRITWISAAAPPVVNDAAKAA